MEKMFEEKFATLMKAVDHKSGMVEAGPSETAVIEALTLLNLNWNKLTEADRMYLEDCNAFLELNTG